MTITVEVPLADRSYPVHVGFGVRELLPEILPEGAKRVAVITQAEVPWEVDPGIDHTVINVPNGESAKSLSVVESVCRQMAAEGFTRSDAIVGVGGGVVTDLAGFVASVYHRGIRFVTVSTTLLGQVDVVPTGKAVIQVPLALAVSK